MTLTKVLDFYMTCLNGDVLDEGTRKAYEHAVLCLINRYDFDNKHPEIRTKYKPEFAEYLLARRRNVRL